MRTREEIIESIGEGIDKSSGMEVAMCRIINYHTEILLDIRDLLSRESK